MLTPETYLKWHSNACKEAVDFLRDFVTMDAAWNSNDAWPEQMLWALCYDTRVLWEDLLTMAEQLLEAGLCSGTFHERAPGVTQTGFSRYTCAPWLGGTIDSQWSDEDRQKQRDIIRKAFPAPFDCTDEEYTTAQLKGTYQ